MALLDDLKKIHTALTTDIVPRAKDAVDTLEHVLTQASEGHIAGATAEAYADVKAVIEEIETALRSTQSVPATVEVEQQAPNLGGMTIAEIAAAQPTPVVAPIPTAGIVPTPVPVPVPEPDTTTTSDTTPDASSGDTTPDTTE